MSFDYETIRKQKNSGGTQWAAYSDLFMVLAFVFLLMYMVSSLRTEMASVSTHAQIEDVKKELQMYETIKENYLKQDASDYERKLYEDILDQISLLENETKSNKERLSQEYNEQKIREKSLNQYQQMIRTVMNANAIAKSDASKQFNLEIEQNKQLEREVGQRREDLANLSDRIKAEEREKRSLSETHYEETRELEKRFQDLKSENNENQQNLASLEDTLRSEAEEKEELKLSHENETRNLERKYENLQGKHDEDKDQLALLENKLGMEQDKIDDLKDLYSIEKRSLEDKISRLSSRHDDRLRELSSLEEKLREEADEKRALRNKLSKETASLENQLQELSRSQEKSKRNIASLQDKLESADEEKDDLRSTLSSNRKELEDKIREQRINNGRNQEKMALLEDKLKAKEAEKRSISDAYADAKNDMEDKIKNLKGRHDDSLDKVARLSSDLDNANKDLNNANKDLSNASKDLNKTKSDLEKKSRDLDNALELEKKRRDIARRIRDNFNDNGINADVNSNTGDVILDFGDSYFDTDSHRLKPGMKITIRKAIPVYAQSLFGSEMLAAKISSVEIIGFASPTYAGKPVDPTALSAETRTAVNYNLDLSYRRARSIFEYVFDTDKIKFRHQDKMVHLINVTGRSFFSEKIDPGYSGGLTIDEFCGQYNCLKSQRVIIKFGLSEKGEA